MQSISSGEIFMKPLPLVTKVQFESQGEKIIGNLYLPNNHQQNEKLPVVIITGAWTTVKEQMPKIYAIEIASRGYAALTLDFRGWGESKRHNDSNNFIESPVTKIADIEAAANFLASQAILDSSRIYGLALCASAGYMAEAAFNSNYISRIALVAPWIHDESIVESVYGGKEAVSQLIQSSANPRILEAASNDDKNSVMFQVPYYTESNRGMIKEWDNKFNTKSWEEWLLFNSVKIADYLKKPTIIIHSESAAIPQGVKAFYSKLDAPKDQVWLKDVTQFDFYDQTEPMTQAVDAAVQYFGKKILQPVLVDQQCNQSNKDKAMIKTVIESIALMADSHNFESLEKLYANPVKVDYTSLSGGQPETLNPKILISRWAEVLPGFDCTRHVISNIEVDIKNNIAYVSADVVADHYLNTQFWQAKGTYDYEIQKFGESWKVTYHRFNLKEEVGSRDIFKIAIENATKNPTAYLVREQSQEVVRNFLISLETKDMDKFASVWANDAVQEMPYSPGDFPKRVAGKDNLLKLYSSWPQNSGKANFTNELVFYTTQDPKIVWAEYHGEVEIISTGRFYDQRYAGLFHIRNGKIELFREYYDPIVFAYAFNLNKE